MEHLNDYLNPIDLKLSALLLDPNNPRFSELGEEPSAVPESRFSEPKVQQTAYEKMKNPKFNVIELRDTIKELGFLPMDRLVVRKWRDSKAEAPKYVVVEGNRRVAALKWLLDLYDQGKQQLTKKQIANYTSFQVLLLDEERAPQTTRLILPGLRHVSGIKEWGPYQKARMVYELRQTGKSSQDVAQSLGLSTREANQLWRAFLALNQMKDDEEYGEHAEVSLYSYFEEVFKKPNVRNWLGWSDEDGKFLNQEELSLFYSWIRGTSEDDDEDAATSKLPEAKSVRLFSKVLDDPDAFSVFKTSGGSLTRALARVEADNQKELLPTINECAATLSALSPDRLRKMNDGEIEKLNNLAKRIAQILKDRKALLKSEK